MSALWNSLLFLILVMLSFVVKAEGYTYDQTYTHDNTYCHYAKTSIEIEVRSREKYTEPQDGEFGEYVYLLAGEKKKLLAMNDHNIGRYRLLKGKNNVCSKALSIPLNQQEIAIFMARENKPLADTLTILYFNTRTGSSEVINTEIKTSKAIVENGKVYFKKAGDQCNQTTGYTNIDGNRFTYTKKDFEPWMIFDGKSFIVDKDKTFDTYEGKKYYASSQDFFQNQNGSLIIKEAINPGLKTKCISFTEIDGWKCISYL
jgi:hypothetical protein